MYIHWDRECMAKWYSCRATDSLSSRRFVASTSQCCPRNRVCFQWSGTLRISGPAIFSSLCWNYILWQWRKRHQCVLGIKVDMVPERVVLFHWHMLWCWNLLQRCVQYSFSPQEYALWWWQSADDQWCMPRKWHLSGRKQLHWGFVSSSRHLPR